MWRYMDDVDVENNKLWNAFEMAVFPVKNDDNDNDDDDNDVDEPALLLLGLHLIYCIYWIKMPI